MTKIQKLIEDARQAGWSIVKHGDATRIEKRVKINQHSFRVKGLLIYPDGYAVRLDVPLDAASCVRSTETMRTILEMRRRRTVVWKRISSGIYQSSNGRCNVWLGGDEAWYGDVDGKMSRGFPYKASAQHWCISELESKS